MMECPMNQPEFQWDGFRWYRDNRGIGHQAYSNLDVQTDKESNNAEISETFLKTFSNQKQPETVETMCNGFVSMTGPHKCATDHQVGELG